MTATTKQTTCEKCGRKPAVLDVAVYSLGRNDEQQTEQTTAQTLALCSTCAIKLPAWF